MPFTVSATFDTAAEAAAFINAALGGKPAAAGKGATATPAAAPAAPKPKNTREAMAALLSKIAETDKAGAKAIVSAQGKAPKMAEIPEENIDAVFDAATEKLAAMAAAAAAAEEV